MPGEAQVDDIAAIRDLLLDAFTAADLRRLFLYTANAELRPLSREFGPGDGLTAMVERTVSFCRTRDLLPDLLREVEKERPRRYARFAGRQAATTTPPPAPAGTTYHIHIEQAQGLAIGDGAQVIGGREG